MGRECITHYSTLRRYCVFSHDELVCKMALEADTLSLTVALAAYRDMRTMLHDERKLRKSLLDWVRAGNTLNVSPTVSSGDERKLSKLLLDWD